MIKQGIPTESAGLIANGTAECVLLEMKAVSYRALYSARVVADAVFMAPGPRVLLFGFKDFLSIAVIARALAHRSRSLLTMCLQNGNENQRRQFDLMLEGLTLFPMFPVEYLSSMDELQPSRSHDCCFIDVMPHARNVVHMVQVLHSALTQNGILMFRWPVVANDMAPEDTRSFEHPDSFLKVLIASQLFIGFRRVGRFVFARKHDPRLIRSALEQALIEEDPVLSIVSDRAHVDPEFRSGLLQAPDAAIAAVNTRSRSQVHFEDVVAYAPRSPVVTSQGDLVAFLERPSWERSIPRWVLEAMIAG